MTNAKKPTAAMVEAGLTELRGGYLDAPIAHFTQREIVAEIYTAMRALDPEVKRLTNEAARQQTRADQQAEWAIREAERCVELEKVFAETAILLTHPDEGRRAVAKERVLAALEPAAPVEDGEVAALVERLRRTHGAGDMHLEVADFLERLAPQPPAADALVLYAPVVGETMDEWRENVRKTELYQRGDTVLVWVNESDLYERLSLAKLQGGGE